MGLAYQAVSVKYELYELWQYNIGYISMYSKKLRIAEELFM